MDNKNKQLLVNKITEVINAIKNITNTGICFYDMEHFFHYDSFGVHDNRGHYCEFCKNTRLLDNKKSCIKSDREDALYMANEYKRPFFHECHMGLCECIIPVFYENNFLGIIFIGQCRIKGEDKSDFIKKRAEQLGGNGDDFVGYYNALPEISKKQLMDIGTVVRNYFNVLVDSVGNDIMTEIGAQLHTKKLSERVCNYIKSNYMHEITLSSVSGELFLNPSHVARTFKKETGMTVTQYTNRIRCENAKVMLLETTVPIKNIAINVGISDANYFTRVFKKNTGMTPEEYRK